MARDRQRVLMVAAEYPPHVGGVASYTQAVVAGLRETGAQVRVVTSVPDRAGTRLPGVTVTRTPALLNRRLVKTLALLAAGVVCYLRDRPHWVVLTKCTHEGLVGYVLKRLFGARYLVVAYGAELLERKHDPLVRAVFRAADRILVDSVYAKGLMHELGIDGDVVQVLYPGFARVPLVSEDQVRSTRARYGLDGKLVLLTVARLVRHKGHDQVLRALAGLVDRHPHIVYLIVGAGEERASLERQIACLGLTPLVRMLGGLPQADVDSLYQACDVFVMPSRQEGTDVEGLGMVYFEAALRGKPVIGGRSGGSPDAIRDGETGILVDPTDAGDIARALDRVLSDAALRRQMGKAGRSRVLEEFSVARSAAQLSRHLTP